MKTSNKTYWIIAVIAGIVALVSIIVFTESHYDKKLVIQIHRYKDARKEILRTIPFLTPIASSNPKLQDGLKIDFEISKEFADLNGLDTLEQLYSDKLIQGLFIAENGEVVFKLKETDYLNEVEEDKGIQYVHFLSKNRVNFDEKNSHVQVVERTTIEEWSYVIISFK